MEAGQRTRTINTRGVANGRTTRRRWATTAAAALFTMLVAGSGIANAQTVIWEATLTVEALGNRVGYSRSQSLGSLSSTTFRYNGQTFTANDISVSILEGATKLFLGVEGLLTGRGSDQRHDEGTAWKQKQPNCPARAARYTRQTARAGGLRS